MNKTKKILKRITKILIIISIFIILCAAILAIGLKDSILEMQNNENKGLSFLLFFALLSYNIIIVFYTIGIIAGIWLIYGIICLIIWLRNKKKQKNISNKDSEEKLIYNKE